MARTASPRRGRAPPASTCTTPSTPAARGRAQQDLSATTTSYAPAVTAATRDESLAWLASTAWTKSDGTIGMEELVGSSAMSLGDVPGASSGNGPGLAATPGDSDAYAVGWVGSGGTNVYYTQ
jgi:hypothetical protein